MLLEDRIKSRLKELDGGAHEKERYAKTLHASLVAEVQPYVAILHDVLHDFQTSDTYTEKFHNNMPDVNTSQNGQVAFCTYENPDKDAMPPDYSFIVLIQHKNADLVMTITFSSWFRSHESCHIFHPVFQQVIQSPELAGNILEETIVEFLATELNNEPLDTS